MSYPQVAPSRKPGLHQAIATYLRDQPITCVSHATGGQSRTFPMTTVAKYNSYISRPIATANYPQSCAGSRRRRTVWGVPGHCVVVCIEKVGPVHAPKTTVFSACDKALCRSNTWLFLIVYMYNVVRKMQ